MKRSLCALALLVVASCLFQGWAAGANVKNLRYCDAVQFRKINHGFSDSRTPFFRLPASVGDTVRKGLKTDAEMSAGIGFRFATNSKAIAVKYTLTLNFKMSHQAFTGTRGCDLYVLNGKKWQFANCVKPADTTFQNKMLLSNQDGKMHEYMLYLPLYDGIKQLEIGIDSTAVITQPVVNSPRREKRFVFYGTSILQGGCASRPGMVGTSIIQRDLDAECINLGFSGEGRMDIFMAETMGRIPNVTAFIIDPVPNCTAQRCDTITYDFINTLRKARPDVPIFMVERQKFSYEFFEADGEYNVMEVNNAFHENYLKLVAENPRNLYYIDRENLIDPDNEGSVDGAHLTDLGFYFYALKLEPYLKAVLDGKKVPQSKKVKKHYQLPQKITGK